MNYTIYHNYKLSFTDNEHELVRAFRLLHPNMRMKIRMITTNKKEKEVFHYKAITSLGLNICAHENGSDKLVDTFLARDVELIILLPN